MNRITWRLEILISRFGPSIATMNIRCDVCGLLKTMVLNGRVAPAFART